MRPAILAAFARARDAGLTAEAVVRVLAPVKAAAAKDAAGKKRG